MEGRFVARGWKGEGRKGWEMGMEGMEGCFAAWGWKGEGGRGGKGREKEREGGDVVPLHGKGVQGREEGKGRSNGELTLTPEP